MYRYSLLGPFSAAPVCTCSIAASWDWVTDQGHIYEDVGCDLSMAFLFEGASQDPASGSASATHRGCIHCVPVNLCGRCFRTLEVSYILSLSLSPLYPTPPFLWCVVVGVVYWMLDINK